MASAAKTPETDWAAVGARMPRPAAETLARMAADHGVPPDELAGEILAERVAAWERGDEEVTTGDIRLAREAAAKGEYIDQGEVERRMEEWIARTRA